MLKIYLCTFKYEIHNENEIIELNTYSDYEIIDENAAISKTAEFGAYTDFARDEYIYSSSIKQKRKGKCVYYWRLPCDVYLEEWKYPNAKLVVHVTYEEDSCSMKKLMDLPAADVIAYLKQEGVNFSLTK